MATVSQVVSAGLKSIIVLGNEADLESADAQDFIFAMNNFMLDLDANGVKLGYTEVSNLGDEVTIPSGALRGLIANVAIEVAPDYGGMVSAALQQRANSGLKTMKHLGIQIRSSAYPSTLPIGSGNEGEYTYGYNNYFYPDLEQEILSEANGLPNALLTMASNTTATTITTAGTSVLALGTWSIDRSTELAATVAGRVTYSSEPDQIVDLSATLDIAPSTLTNQVMSVYFALNGVEITESRNQGQASTSLPDTIVINYRQKLDKNDYLEIYVANDTSTDNLLITDASFRVN